MQPTKQQIDRGHEDRLGRMYVSYYNLIENPFRSGNNPRYFWLCEKHLEALAYLKLGVEDDKGILVLTGEEGVGKSVLLDCLIRVVEFDIFAAPFNGRDACVHDFFKFFAETFRLGDIARSKVNVLAGIKEFLKSSYQNNRKVLLILKNAHTLDHEIMEQARLLSDFEVHGRKLLSILFIGSDRFLEVISQPDNKALLQRVAIRCRLDPLSEEDTGAYIKHRIKTAGGVRELFTSEAVREIHSVTKGNPGLINIICDHALMKGYLDRLGTIDDEVIKHYARNTRHLLDCDSKEIPEYKVAPTESRVRKTGAERRWVFLVLAMVVAPLFWIFVGELRRSFHSRPPSPKFQNIYFELSETTLPDSATITLKKVVGYLKENPASRIRIVGHSDNVGSRKANIRLSRKRAEMVKERLLARNINQARIEIDSKGPDSPTATNDTSEGRKKNRRVEIEVIH
jgi:type II secretory pathway predicted ATPase ExeA/outer membrane protein OmpA-like peptidoglycan-associated protein